MYKNATYKEKFVELNDWISLIIEPIKKELRNEHLKKDFHFVKRFLSNKNIHKLTAHDLAQAYQKAISEDEKGEDLAEFITSRWILKNSDLYEFFERNLSQISPDFANLDEIDTIQAENLIENAVQQFGAPHTYLFSVLNSVVFPKESYQKLKSLAQNDQEKQNQEKQIALEKRSVEQTHKDFEREIARLTDKYEKKLNGLQKKYVADVESLKKQISQLQRKCVEKKLI